MGEIVTEKNEKPRFILLGFFIFIIIATLSFAVWFLMSTETIEDKNSYIIPEWVKANAGWWSEGEITDEEFSYSLQWLFDNGLVEVKECTGRCL